MMDKEERKKAMKAFRRKLNRMRQDEESRLGHGAMTKGHKSAIVGIRPPDDFPRETWKALVEEGLLKYEGGGMYALAGDLGTV